MAGFSYVASLVRGGSEANKKDSMKKFLLRKSSGIHAIQQSEGGSKQAGGTHFVRVHLSKATEATRVLGLIEESWLWLGRWAYQQTHVYLSQLFLLLFFPSVRLKCKHLQLGIDHLRSLWQLAYIPRYLQIRRFPCILGWW